MNFIKNISLWWRLANRRRKVSISTPTSGKEWHTHISPVRVVMVIVAIVVSLFLLLLALVGYTSILEILPVYRTAADRSRERVIENITKIDSMERVISDIIIYNENVGLIMEGKTPVVRTTLTSDSVKVNRTFTPSNSIDSALRAQMEGEGAYNLNEALAAESKNTNNAITLSSPIEGIITERFDLRENRYGVRIAAISGARIVAVEEGIVMISMWSPESGNIVQILHPNNTISIYKNMSQALVSKGEAVKRGEIIGYNNKAADNSTEQLFEFEMWSDGKPINPERFIIF
ncbi:MAG: M23 family metallopeptidase [Rikenellaceae bacterium]